MPSCACFLSFVLTMLSRGSVQKGPLNTQPLPNEQLCVTCSSSRFAGCSPAVLGFAWGLPFRRQSARRGPWPALSCKLFVSTTWEHQVVKSDQTKSRSQDQRSGRGFPMKLVPTQPSKTKQDKVKGGNLAPAPRNLPKPVRILRFFVPLQQRIF